MARITRPAPDKELRAIQKKFDVAPSGRLFISVPGADLDLVSTDSDKVEIEVFVKSQSKNEALALTDRIKLRMRAVDKQTIRIESKSFYQNGFVGWNADDAIQLRLLIMLPKSFNVDIQAAGSHTTIKSVDGKIGIQLAGGSLQATDLKGTLEISAFGCDLHIDGFKGSKLDVVAASSELEATALNASQLSIRASGSTSQLSKIEGHSTLSFHSGNASVSDIMGTIEAQAEGCDVSFHLSQFDDARFNVCGGALDLHLKPQLKAKLLLEGAELFLDKSFSFSGDREEDRIEGQLNKGNNILHAHAAAGFIRCVPG